MLIALLIGCWIHSSISTECSDGWVTYIEATNKCVKAYNQLETWQGAHAICIAQRGSLVSIHNAFQNSQIAAVGLQAYEDCNWWIGLHDIDDKGNYSWIDDTPADYANWNAGYPPSQTGATVVYLGTNDRNRWTATAQIALRNCFVCEIDAGARPYQGEEYCPLGWDDFARERKACIKKFMEPATWIAALESCERLAPNAGGSLVSIHNEDEDWDAYRMARDANSSSYFWIGLNGLEDPNNYTWSDGSPYNYQHWTTSSGFSPNNPAGTAAYLLSPDERAWATTTSIMSLHSYICKQNTQELQSVCPDGWTHKMGDEHKCIRAFDLQLGWFEALQYCEQRPEATYGNLVSIRSALENFQVATLAQSASVSCTYWIGYADLSYGSSFTWMDRSTIVYQHWTKDFHVRDPGSAAAYLSLQDKLRWNYSSDLMEKKCFVCQTTRSF